MNFPERFRQLDRLLDGYAWLWRPQPYKQARPRWCEELPGLCDALLELSDDELQGLTEDAAALVSLLAEYLPDVAALNTLTALPECEGSELADTGPHFTSGIPGRKWQQITAFASALGGVKAPLLEWCGGKGHLGRLLARQWQHPVLTLELDEDLCAQGEAMAGRTRVAQRFHRGDALKPEARNLLAGRHGVALHACGELHRSLIRHAVEAGAPALDVAPCCYHLHGSENYEPLSEGVHLQLSRDDMRVAVTETVTAAGREVHQRDREMAWKLGFDLLRRELTGEERYRPIKPIDKAWLKLDFAGFCRLLAEREGLVLDTGIDWERYEALGWLRQRETMRLSLVRHAFRRAIEVWLVLDLANYLTGKGYEVSLCTFCERELTPRNILLSARLL